MNFGVFLLHPSRQQMSVSTYYVQSIYRVPPRIEGQALFLQVLCRVDVCISLVQFSCSVVSDSLRPHELHRPPCPSPTPRVHPNPCPLCWWCHSTISSSIVPFSSCFLSLLTSGSFQMNQLFASGGQSTGVSATALVLPMNTQDWSRLGMADWISLQSRWLSRVFYTTTVQKHQFFGTQLSS